MLELNVGPALAAERTIAADHRCGPIPRTDVRFAVHGLPGSTRDGVLGRRVSPMSTDTKEIWDNGDGQTACTIHSRNDRETTG